MLVVSFFLSDLFGLGLLTLLGRTAHEGAEQLEDRDMVLIWMIFSQTRKGIDAAQANRENGAIEHFRALLIALVQQTALRRFGLACRHDTAPDSKWQGNHRCGGKDNITNSRTVGG